MNARKTVVSWDEGRLGHVWRVLLGYDVFISHAHADAHQYAEVLADRLTAKGYACFFDDKETSAGDALSPTLTRALARSHAFVLVASKHAHESEWVEREYAAFPHRRKTVVPIDVDGLIAGGTWSKFEIVERELRCVREDRDAFTNEAPSNHVVDEVARALARRPQRSRARAIVGSVIASLLTLTVLAGWQTHVANRNAAREEKQRRLAEEELRLFTRILTPADPYGLDPTTAEIQGQPIGHDWRVSDALIAASEQSDRYIEDPTVQAAIDHAIGTMLSRLGMPDRAVPLLERALQLHDQTPLDEPQRLLDLLNDLVEAHLGLEHVDAAAALVERARALAGAHGELPPIPRLRTRYNELWLGMLQGRDDLEDEYEVLIGDALEHVRPDNPGVLLAMNDVVLYLMYNAKDLARAERVVVPLWERCKRELGIDHPYTLDAQQNYAQLLAWKDEPEASERALEIQSDEFQLREHRMGRADPNTVYSLRQLGGALLGVGRYDEAVDAYRDALARADENPVPMLWRRGLVLRNLGQALYGQGEDLDGAERALLEAHAELVRTRGPTHTSTAYAAELLVDFYTEAGRADDLSHWNDVWNAASSAER